MVVRGMAMTDRIDTSAKLKPEKTDQVWDRPAELMNEQSHELRWFRLYTHDCSRILSKGSLSILD